MMLTEEQAKEKWCPFARFNIVSRNMPSPGPMNRAGDDRGEDMNPRQARCIGSQCMAWRRVPQYEVHHHVNACRKPELDRPPGDGWQLQPEQNGHNAYWTRENAIAKGYCGLAGQEQP
jgi:hypothetical protein